MDSWGDTASLSGFLHHFLRREYGTFQLAADVEDKVGFVGRLIVFLKESLRETWIAPPIALYCVVQLALYSSNWKKVKLHSLFALIFLGNYVLQLCLFIFIFSLCSCLSLFSEFRFNPIILWCPSSFLAAG